MKHNLFIRLFILSLLLLSTGLLQAQTAETKQPAVENNIVKINLSALVFKNISVQYERKISRKSTLSLNVKYMPKGTIPFKSSVESAIDDASVRVDLLKIGSSGFTAEYRYYLSKKGAFRGFYLGPFVSFNNYKTDLPLNYLNNTKTGVFVGSVSSFTGGLQLGVQWKLGKSIYLDWWILGPNYGSGKGDLILITPLNSIDQLSLRNELETLKNDLPLKVIKSYTVDANGASIRAEGPWAGLRGMGINIGFRF